MRAATMLGANFWQKFRYLMLADVETNHHYRPGDSRYGGGQDL